MAILKQKLRNVAYIENWLQHSKACDIHEIYSKQYCGTHVGI